MTALDIAPIVQLTDRGLTWNLHNTDVSHGCPAVPWCENIHDAAETPETGMTHGREIAAALVDGEPVLEVAIGQYRPGTAWRDTGTIWVPNRHDPYVAMFPYDEDGEPSKMIAIPPEHARSLVLVLRAAKVGPLADALDAGARLLLSSRKGGVW